MVARLLFIRLLQRVVREVNQVQIIMVEREAIKDLTLLIVVGLRWVEHLNTVREVAVRVV
jgi:hypothetical protein